MKSTSLKKCCVPICKALVNKEEKLIPFPKGKKLAKRWAEALGIDEGDTKNAHVCVLHFRQKDFIQSKGSNTQNNKPQLERTAIPSRNLLNPTVAASKLNRCYIKISPLPIQRLKKIVLPQKFTNKLLNFIVNKKQYNNNIKRESINFGNNKKPKSMQLNNENFDKLINTPEYKNTFVKDNLVNTIQSLTDSNLKLIEKPTQLESLNESKTELKSILKKSSSKPASSDKHIKKKVRIKTKLGQFMPKSRKKVVVRDQIKTNKEVINYEVVEQINDCNVLILRMSY